MIQTVNRKPKPSSITPRLRVRVVWIMAPKVNRFWEGYVAALFHAKFSVTQIQKQCRENGCALRTTTIKNIINRHKHNDVLALRSSTKGSRKRPCTAVTPPVARKLRRMALQENPPPQRVMARRAHVAQSTVNRHLRNNLKLRMVFKSRGHVLTAAHRRNTKPL